MASAPAGNAATAGPFRVLSDAEDAWTLVDLPLELLAALSRYHVDQPVASELDDRRAELAFHILWNGITQTTTPPRSITPWRRHEQSATGRQTASPTSRVSDS